MSYKKIGDYGLIGNRHSAALVGIDGSIDWCCLPRFDSPSVFAAILDDAKGGRWQFCPVGEWESQQSYEKDTNILVTTFYTPRGVARVIDFMPFYRMSRRRYLTFDEVHRVVEGVSGRVEMCMHYDPRLDYALGPTFLAQAEHGVSSRRGVAALALASPVPLELSAEGARCRFSLTDGESKTFVLCWGAHEPGTVNSYRTRQKLEKTRDYWKGVASTPKYEGPWREQVVRSFLTLHLLTYVPTGGIVAAPTTSLPEEIGGVRNWDYRFCWLRDASFTLNALFALGHLDEGSAFMRWLEDLYKQRGPRIQIMYSVSHEAELPEYELATLEGYRGSRPVRIGNEAYKQHQLDVYGELLNAAYLYWDQGGRISRRTWGVLENLVEAAAQEWVLPDYGIWEVRAGPFQFVYSNFMCWVALDRGIKMGKALGYASDEVLERWHRIAKRIRQDVLSKGWSQKKQSFVQHYETEALDASNLLMPLFGFLPADDPRMLSTIERTVREPGNL